MRGTTARRLHWVKLTMPTATDMWSLAVWVRPTRAVEWGREGGGEEERGRREVNGKMGYSVCVCAHRIWWRR